MKDLREILKSKTGRKVLLTFFPHPDDETMAAAGLIMAAKTAGWQVVVVSLTAGEAGKIHVNGNGKSLKEIRLSELAKATAILGADITETGSFEDGKLKGGEKRWGPFADEKIREYQPAMVVTYDPSGFYGHPDHVSLSRYLLTKYQSRQANEPEWELWFMAIPQEFRQKTAIRGMSEVRNLMVEATHQLNLGFDWVKKWRAAKAHKSQRLGKDLPVPLWLFMAKYHYEWYHKVEKERKYTYRYSNYEI